MMTQNRIFRIGVTLLGMLFCLHILSLSMPSISNDSLPVNQAVDRIRLKDSDRFEVINEISLPHEVLYESTNFKEWFGTEYVWVHYQMVKAGGMIGGVRYFEFRTKAAAHRGHVRLLGCDGPIGSWDACTVDRFVILVSACERFEEFRNLVFEELEQNSPEN